MDNQIAVCEKLLKLYRSNPQMGTHPEALPGYWLNRLEQIENGAINYQGPGWYSHNGKVWQWSKQQDWFAAELGARWVDDKSINRYIQR